MSNEIDNHKIMVVTEASDHSRIAAHCLIQRVVKEVRKKIGNRDDTLTVHLWRDGCASQFRSRYVFHRTTVFPESYRVIRYYNERHHGKGPMDGIGGCVKNGQKSCFVRKSCYQYSQGIFRLRQRPY